jgi:HTH-type transcriptional regulator / antitoxin HipB
MEGGASLVEDYLASLDFPANTPEQLGAVLRGFRHERGLTQAQLAARLGLTQKAISMIESHPHKMGLDRLFLILAALNIQLVLRDARVPAKVPGLRSRAQW